MDVLPSVEEIVECRSKLLDRIPDRGIGHEATIRHIDIDIVPGLNKSSQSPHYYGFVSGGATPTAVYADNVVTEHDQNVCLHLPEESIATDVEDCALRMVCGLVNLPSDKWPHRTFTTGATASNVLGLACGREYVIAEAGRRISRSVSVGEYGIVAAMQNAGLDRVQVLTTVPHSTLKKAASLVGLGRACVMDVSRKDASHRFGMQALEAALGEPRVASIVSISCADVNTGLFATSGYDEMRAIRKLCDQHGAWIHVDAAFGLLAAVLPDAPEYQKLLAGVRGIELADSITTDAHKLLNVPYECGIFLSSHPAVGVSVFQNPNAAYLDIASTEPTTSADRTIPSPLNIGIENSRRFRALPVYAALAAYGRKGYRDMLIRQVALAREIAKYILQSDGYELLPRPKSSVTVEERLQEIYIIVLFRANDAIVNNELVQRVNRTRKMYISGTQWDGAPAARFAVANWQVHPERDIGLVTEVLQEALAH